MRIMIAFGQELRAAALRLLLRQRAFTTVIAAILVAGATGSILSFSILDSLLYTPPRHVLDPSRVRHVYYSSPILQRSISEKLTYPLLTDLRSEAASVGLFSGYASTEMVEGNGVEGRRVRVALVVPGYFTALGVRPYVGRLLADAELGPARDIALAVVSYSFWQQRFAARADILGRSIELDGRSFAIVGVAPPGFSGIDLTSVQVWLPPSASGVLGATTEWSSNQAGAVFSAFVRLNPGVADATASQVASTIAARSRLTNPDQDAGARIVLGPINRAAGPTRSPLTVLAAVASALSLALLAIAVANVMNLLLARGLSREAEIATRLALGGSHARLGLMVLAESGVIGFLTLAGAIALAAMGLHSLKQALPAYQWPVSILNARTVGVAVILTLAIAFSIGMAPGFQLRQISLVTALTPGPSYWTPRRGRLRSAFNMTQVAFATILVAIGLVFARAYRRTLVEGLGIKAPQAWLVDINTDRLDLDSRQTVDLFVRLSELLQKRPDVNNTAISVGVPLRMSWGASVKVQGAAAIPRLPTGGPYVEAVTPAYFSVLNVRIAEGRALAPSETADAPEAIVNETMARLVWAGKSPLGECVKVSPDPRCRIVVGVASDVRRESAVESATMQVYVPFAERLPQMRPRALFFRVTGAVAPVAAALRTELRSSGVPLAYARIEAVDDLLRPEQSAWKAGATTVVSLSMAASLIAIAGLIANIAFKVAQRESELAVRMAIGASPGRIAWFVSCDVTRDCAGGLLAGVVLLGFASALMPKALFISIGLLDLAPIAGIVTCTLGIAITTGLFYGYRLVQRTPVELLRASQ
jgi:predicted permease